MPAGSLLTFKVVLVGDGKVGKTWILNRWINPTAAFDDYYEPTVSPELTTKDVSVDGGIVRLQVWDMGFGEQESATQFPRYVGGAAGAVLMYDMSDPPSVDGVAHWHEQVTSLAGSSCVFVVCGCKSDLPSAGGALQKARNFCESIRVEHVETSAQSGVGAVKVFEALARKLRGQAQKDIPRTPVAQARQPPSSPRVALEATVPILASPTPAQGKADGTPVPVRRVKLVLLGEPCVGKSCVAQRLGGDCSLLTEDYVATAGPEILTKRVPVNGSFTRLQVWDAPGQELMSDTRMMAPVLQDLDAALIIYDVTAKATFDSVRSWMRLLEGHAGAETAVMLVGNKADKPQRAVSMEEGQRCAEALRIPFAEFSAFKAKDALGLLSALLAGGRPPPAWESGSPGQPQPSTPRGSEAHRATGIRDLAATMPVTASPDASAAAMRGPEAGPWSASPPPRSRDQEASRFQSPVRRNDQVLPTLPAQQAALPVARSEVPLDAEAMKAAEKKGDSLMNSTEAALRGPTEPAPVASPISLPGPGSAREREDSLLAGSISTTVRRRDVGNSPPRPKEPRQSEPLPQRHIPRRPKQAGQGFEEGSVVLDTTSPVGATKDPDRLGLSQAAAIALSRTSPLTAVGRDGCTAEEAAAMVNQLNTLLNSGKPAAQGSEDGIATPHERLSGSCLLPMSLPAGEASSETPKRTPSKSPKARHSQSVVFPMRMGEPSSSPTRKERPPALNAGTALVPASSPSKQPSPPSNGAVEGPAVGAAAAGGQGLLLPQGFVPQTPSGPSAPLAGAAASAPSTGPASGPLGSPTSSKSGNSMLVPGGQQPHGQQGSPSFAATSAQGSALQAGPATPMPQATPGGSQAAPPGALGGMPPAPSPLPPPGQQGAAPQQPGIQQSSGSVLFPSTSAAGSVLFPATPTGSAMGVAGHPAPTINSAYMRATSPKAVRVEGNLAHSQPLGRAPPYQSNMTGRMSSFNSPEANMTSGLPSYPSEAMQRDAPPPRSAQQRGGQDNRRGQSPNHMRYDGSVVMPSYNAGARMSLQQQQQQQSQQPQQQQQQQRGNLQASPLAARPNATGPMARQRQPQAAGQAGYGYNTGAAPKVGTRPQRPSVH